MSFAAPVLLLTGLLIAVVVVLHIQRRRVVSVPSLEIWRQLQGIKSAAPQRLHWPRPSLLMLLQVLAVIAAALALAQPLWGGPRPPEHWIAVVDRSASMQIADAPEGQSRLAAALSGLGAATAEAGSTNLARVSLVSVGPTARPVLARQKYDPVSLAEAAAQVDQSDGTADWNGAASLIGSLAHGDAPTRIKVFTDAEAIPQEIVAAAGDVPVDLVRFGAPMGNSSVVARVEALDAQAGRWRVSGEVTIAGGAGQSTLVVRFGAVDAIEPIEWATLVVGRPNRDTAIDRPATFPFEREIELPGPGILTVELPPDAASFDNVARFVLSTDARPFEVLYLGAGDQPVVRALQSIPGVDVFTADALPQDVARFALVVVDDVAVPRSPETNTLWIGTGRVEGEPEPGRSASADPVRWAGEHALTEGLNWANVSIASASQLQPWQDGRVLLEANGGPLLEARTTEFGREVRLAFDPAQSDWPLNPSFPGFIWRVVNWTGATPGVQVRETCVVGLPCAVDARLIGGTVEPVGDSAMLSPLALARMQSELTHADSGRFLPDKAGIYRLTKGDRTELVAVDAIRGSESLPASTTDAGIPAAKAETAWPTPLWIWAAAALLLLLVVEGGLAGRGQERFLHRVALASTNSLAGHRRLLLGLRIVTVALALAACVNLPLPWYSRGEQVVLLVAPADGDTPLVARAKREAVATGGEEKLAIVTLGTPSEIVDAGAPASLGSRLAAAGAGQSLLLAAAMLPEAEPGRVIVEQSPLLLSGDAAAVAPEFAARGISVDYLATDPAAQGSDVVLRTVEAPRPIYQGDDFPLTGVVYAPTSTPATIDILRDGDVVASQTSDLRAGHNRIDAVVADAPAGTSLYEMLVSVDGDTVIGNNRDGVAVTAALSGPVAIIAPEPEAGAAFAEMLAGQGIESVTLTPNRAPFTIAQWLRYRGIALLDVPAIALDTNQQNLIEQAVFEYGRGLMILGGENSFGPGGYLQTPLDRVSPLSSSVPKDAPAVVLAFVLDRSGSMQQPVGTATRLDVAKQATVSAIELLNAESQVSIIAFDELAQSVLPLQTVPDLEALGRGLRRLTPGGGTSIYPGLALAFEQLRTADAAAKHVVVMTDGLTEPGDFAGIIAEMRAAGITVSTVAVGSSARRDVVEDIATMGGGAFHGTNDVRALPSILSQEAMMLAGAPVEEGVTQPQWVERSGFLTGLPDVVPTIEAFVLTTAKPQATVSMVAPDRTGEPQPVLAHWRYGGGKVLALTTNAVGDWTRAWQALDTYPAFWSEVVREFLSTNATPGIQLATTRQADDIVIAVEALDKDGIPLDVPMLVASVATRDGDSAEQWVELLQLAPGRYRGRFVAAPGNYDIRVENDNVEASAVAHVGVPAMLRPSEDSGAIMRLALATGGRAIGPDDPLLTGGDGRWITIPGATAWLGAALALLMLDLFVRYGAPLRGFGLGRRSAARTPLTQPRTA